MTRKISNVITVIKPTLTSAMCMHTARNIVINSHITVLYARRDFDGRNRSTDTSKPVREISTQHFKL